jgi:hypothetical protein
MNTATSNVLNLSARRYACVAALVLSVVMLFSLPSCGQASSSTNNGAQLPRRIPPPREIEQQPMESMGTTPVFYEKRLQMLNAAQHQAMVADTDRLLKLVADLNSQINSSHSNALTPDQLRMVADIEKLAHSVKDKMRMSVRSAGEYNGPTPGVPFGPR